MECAYYFDFVGYVAQGNGRSVIHFVAEQLKLSVEDPQATRFICW